MKVIYRFHELFLESKNANTNESIITPAIIAPIKTIFIILSKESKDLDKAKNVSSLFTIVYLFQSVGISLNFDVTLSTSVSVLKVAFVYFTFPSEYPYKVLIVSTSVIKRFSWLFLIYVQLFQYFHFQNTYNFKVIITFR